MCCFSKSLTNEWNLFAILIHPALINIYIDMYYIFKLKFIVYFKHFPWHACAEICYWKGKHSTTSTQDTLNHTYKYIYICVIFCLLLCTSWLQWIHEIHLQTWIASQTVGLCPFLQVFLAYTLNQGCVGLHQSLWERSMDVMDER